MRQKCWIGMILIIGWTSCIWAFNVEIPNEFFPAEKPKSSRICVVSNPESKPVAIEVSMSTRKMDINGNEERGDINEDEFLIIPNTLLLMPGDEQIVNVTWQGETPTAEVPYRIIFNEVNTSKLETAKLKNDQQAGQITILRKMVYSMYVTPEKAKSDVVLDELSPTMNNSQPKLKVVILNQGSAHQIIRNIELAIESLGSSHKKMIYKPDDLQIVANILNGAKQQFIVPWPSDLPVGPVKGTLSFQTE